MQLICTTVYSFSDLECSANKDGEREQLYVSTSHEICEPNTCFVEPVFISECADYYTNFFLEASVLYWRPRVFGTEFASKPIIMAEFTPEVEKFKNISVNGCLASINLDWNWGFTAGVGCNLPCDCGDIFLNYSDFSSKGCESLYAKKDNEYVVNYKSFLILGPVDVTAGVISKKAKSKLCTHLHALELSLGKSPYIRESVSLYPKVGLEFFWSRLGQNTRYISGKPITLILEDRSEVNQMVVDTAMKDCSKFSGVGPYFALGTEWHFCYGIYFYGNVSGSLIYGLFTTHHKDKLIINILKENEPPVPPFKNCIYQSRHAFVPRVDTQIGIAYTTPSYCSKMELTLKLAFDAQYIWRINQMLENRDASLNYERISEDMSIHGVTFDIRLDF